MSKTKKIQPIIGEQKDKLIIALLQQDIVDSLNIAMRARGLHLTIDYESDELPKLYVERPDTGREQWMLLNPRTKVCLRYPVIHPDLHASVNDLIERMAKLDGQIVLVADTTKTGKRCAKLQVRIEGAKKFCLTILTCVRGRTVRDNHFTL